MAEECLPQDERCRNASVHRACACEGATKTSTMLLHHGIMGPVLQHMIRLSRVHAIMVRMICRTCKFMLASILSIPTRSSPMAPRRCICGTSHSYVVFYAHLENIASAANYFHEQLLLLRLCSGAGKMVESCILLHRQCLPRVRSSTLWGP